MIKSTTKRKIVHAELFKETNSPLSCLWLKNRYRVLEQPYQDIPHSMHQWS